MSHRLFPISLIILLTTSCTEMVSDEFPDFEPLPSLSCILVEGDSLFVHVSMVEKVDSTAPIFVPDAEIELIMDGLVLQDFQYQGEGLYFTDHRPLPGVYELTAHVEDYENLMAVDTLPGSIPVEIIAVDPVARVADFGEVMEKVSFRFKDNPRTNDFYELVVLNRYYNIRDSTYRTSRQYAFNESSEVLLNEGLDPYSSPSLVFSDELMTDSIMELSLEYYEGYVNCYGSGPCHIDIDAHTVIILLRHVSQEYYRFKKSFYLYNKALYGDFIEGTATALPLYSNIENGKGIFAAYAESLDSVYVEEDYMILE